MPAPESLNEQLVVALAARLATINATTEPDVFHYTPSAIVRVDDLLAANLRKDDDVVIQLLEGDEFPKEMTTGEFDVEAEVLILTAKRWPADQKTNPYTSPLPTPIPATIRNRLVRDIKTAVYRDVSFGGLCDNTEIRDINRDVRIEQNVIWICAHLRLLFIFNHLKAFA